LRAAARRGIRKRKAYLGLARRVDDIQALPGREYGLDFVEASLDAAEHGRPLAGRVHSVHVVVDGLGPSCKQSEFEG